MRLFTLILVRKTTVWSGHLRLPDAAAISMSIVVIGPCSDSNLKMKASASEYFMVLNGTESLDMN
jgi:hypothetical protein